MYIHIVSNRGPTKFVIYFWFPFQHQLEGAEDLPTRMSEWLPAHAHVFHVRAARTLAHDKHPRSRASRQRLRAHRHMIGAPFMRSASELHACW